MKETKFGDIIIAVATLAIILVLLAYPVTVLAVNAVGFDMGPTVGIAIAILISATLSGYIHAQKIWEDRTASIAKITVLGTVLLLLFTASLMTLPDWTTMVREANEAAYPDLTTAEWLNLEIVVVYLYLFINAAISLAMGFIGLYLGTTLKKPTKPT